MKPGAVNDFELWVLGDGADEALHFGGKDLLDVLVIGDEVVESAAAFSEVAKEVFVEVFTDADGGKVDSFFVECTGLVFNFLGAGDALVGDAIGEQDHTVCAFAVEGLFGLFIAKHETGF